MKGKECRLTYVFPYSLTYSNSLNIHKSNLYKNRNRGIVKNPIKSTYNIAQ